MHSRLSLVCLSVIVLALAAPALDQAADRPRQPLGGGQENGPLVAGAQSLPGPVPGGYYSFEWETFAYSGFGRISTRDGEMGHLWSIGLEPDPRPWVFGPTPTGLAFDLDGTMYTTLNIFSFDPNEAQSQFARVDTRTGAVTLIGQPFGIDTAGGDIDACGNYYATGFMVPHLGYIWGDGYLYRIDKYTGVPTPLGFTGMTDWMDLAFDSTGTLWATTQNKLFTLDTTTGASTFVTDIHGVPDAGDPRWMEVMSIAFDDQDTLYGTAMTVFWDDPNGSPVMQIDVNTGVATLLGYTHQYYNHGGDMMPKMVKVAHRKPGGGYACISIHLNDLHAHLAHGDYVPGTNGHACTCP